MRKCKHDKHDSERFYHKVRFQSGSEEFDIEEARREGNNYEQGDVNTHE